MLFQILGLAYGATTLFSAVSTHVKYASAKSNILRKGYEKVNLEDSNRGASEVFSDILADNWFLLIPIVNIVKTIKLLKIDRFKYAEEERKPLLLDRGVIKKSEKEEPKSKGETKPKEETKEKEKESSKEPKREPKPTRETKPEREESKPKEKTLEEMTPEELHVELVTCEEKDAILRQRYSTTTAAAAKTLIKKEMWANYTRYTNIKTLLTREKATKLILK